MYPALDDRTVKPDPALTGMHSWSYGDNITMWQAYLGAAYGGDDVSPYAAPARATDLIDLPPLYMEIVELDILRNEAIDYARRCLAAGVPTELHVHSGIPHSFETVAFESAVAQRMMADRIRNLRSL